MSKRPASGGADRLRFGAALVDLPLLDRLELDVLVVGIFAEDRPLKGTAGLCDWRLNGRLSAIIQTEGFSGQPGETLLTDTNQRLASARMLLLGLGSRAKLSLSSLRHEVRNMLVVAKKARFAHLGLEPPGLALGLIPTAELVQATLEVVRKAYPKADLTLLCPDKECLEAVGQVAAKDDRLSLGAMNCAPSSIAG